ncbi:MAG: histidinol-phosphatase [Lentisphaerae bacterium]|nr:histidinol-phosphatase [Lentisphaerota bacterium]
MIKANFHTHTWRCKHATGCVADYCQMAVEQGVTVLGFSEHCPHPDGRWQAVRMQMDELPEYLAEIAAARRDFPQLRILSGLECEWVPEFEETQREYFLKEMGCDFLVGAAHSYLHDGVFESAYGRQLTAADLRAYADYTVQSMRTGLYAFYAHPDLFAMSIWEWDRAADECSRTILQAAEEYRVPLEINAYGLRKPEKEYSDGPRRMYPVRQFWELAAEYQVSVVVSSDAHQPEDVWGNTGECTQIAQNLGLRVVNDQYETWLYGAGSRGGVK